MSRATPQQSAAMRALLSSGAIEQAFELAETLELTHLDLRGMVLERIDFEHTRTMRGVDLRGASINNSWLDGLDLRGADLRDICLSADELIDVDLRDARLDGVRLWGTVLDRSDLRGVDLRGVSGIWGSLRGCDLRGADLRGVDLSCCDLREAMLDGTDLTAVWLSAQTRLPPGTQPPQPLWGAGAPQPAPIPAALGWTPPKMLRDDDWEALRSLLAGASPALCAAALPGLLWALRAWTPYQTRLTLRADTARSPALLALTDELTVGRDVALGPLIADFPIAHRLVRLDAPAALVEAVLPRCPNLRELTIMLSPGDDVARLAAAPELAQLRDLWIRPRRARASAAAILGAPQLRGLQRLALDHVALDPPALAAPHRLGQPPRGPVHRGCPTPSPAAVDRPPAQHRRPGRGGRAGTAARGAPRRGGARSLAQRRAVGGAAVAAVADPGAAPGAGGPDAGGHLGGRVAVLTLDAMSVTIYLRDINPDLTAAWRAAFDGIDGVHIGEGDIFEQAADAIVSPANSFGFMNGGIDLVYSRHFGWALQERLQRHIESDWDGEIPIGMAAIVSTEDPELPWLISAPTMRAPGVVAETMNAYLAFRASLLAVRRFNQDAASPIRSILCPGLGTAVGLMPPARCASQMRMAHDWVLGGQRPPLSQVTLRTHQKIEYAMARS